MSNLRQAAQQALEAMGTVGADWICEASHHAKKDQHKWGEPCPLQQRWHVAYQALRAALAEEALQRLTDVQQEIEAALAEPNKCTHGVTDGNCKECYMAEPKQEPVAQRRPFDILVITTAYEQGVGKGHQAHGRGVEIENPYAPGECQQAWALGYDEGKKQAASLAYGIKGEYE